MANISDRRLTLFILLFLSLVVVSECFQVTCPQGCSCEETENVNTQVVVDCANLAVPFDTLPGLLPTSEVANFTGNSLLYLDEESFRGTQYLTRLDFSNNQLESLGAKTFTGLPNLRDVNLNGNKLTFIYPSVFHEMQSPNVQVSLSQNPWRCNCALKQAWNDMTKLSGVSFDPFVCAAPKEYSGKLISEINGVCEEKLRPHDVAVIVIAVVTLVLSIFLHFFKEIKGLVISRVPLPKIGSQLKEIKNKVQKRDRSDNERKEEVVNYERPPPPSVRYQPSRPATADVLSSPYDRARRNPEINIETGGDNKGFNSMDDLTRPSNGHRSWNNPQPRIEENRLVNQNPRGQPANYRGSSELGSRNENQGYLDRRGHANQQHKRPGGMSPDHNQAPLSPGNWSSQLRGGTPESKQTSQTLSYKQTMI